LKVSKIISIVSSRHADVQALAQQFSIPVIEATELLGAKARDLEQFLRMQVDTSGGSICYLFLFSDEGLSLVQLSEQKLLSIRADFYSPTVTYRRYKGGGKGQMIAKAVGLNSAQALRVLDATAGLGGDAFVLASLGCHLTMTERVPEVRALLADGLRAAAKWGAENEQALLLILKRMVLIGTDAASYMQSLADEDRPDVVYLDPMFPARGKRAQVKKEMSVFHHLVGTDPDADGLLELALVCAKKRVVVKRPRIAPKLADHVPSHSLEGKSNRYDVYMCGA
jgi:16S rRNA (guanine1516-N2)-methyltransferase